jgi:AraC-like DNA-binding protein
MAVGVIVLEWIDQLNKAIGYLETHLNEKIDYQAAARVCCCSLSKFQQIFLLATGVTLSEYVRFRRMSIAAHELINTDVKVLDLAIRLEYESPEAFARAYQSFHGVSPTVTRKTGVHDEFERIVCQAIIFGGRSRMGKRSLLRIETERLLIRKFAPDDWQDLLEIAISKEASPFAGCDHQWPTDEAGIRQAAGYFAQGSSFWAVEVKDIHKVVCLVNFNYMNEEQTLDIGHVMNAAYQGQGVEYEALKALYNFAFLQLGAEKIQAVWALQDQEKLAPLIQLGMLVTAKSMADRFHPDSESGAAQFESCTLTVTRNQWLAQPAK